MTTIYDVDRYRIALEKIAKLTFNFKGTPDYALSEIMIVIRDRVPELEPVKVITAKACGTCKFYGRSISTCTFFHIQVDPLKVCPKWELDKLQEKQP